jgi:ParB/RepB/Spo0J family partition protein
MIQQIDVEKLIEHPENRNYFDDIVGMEFEDLKTSIVENGIIDPLTVKKEGDKYIVISGNQRLRAAVELRMQTLPCIVRNFKNRNEEIRFIVEANLRRRHLTLTQRAKSLYHLYCITEGKNRKERIRKIASVTGSGKTSAEALVSIAEKLVPELRNIIDAGDVNSADASIIANLSPELQYKVYEKLKGLAAEGVRDEVKSLLDEIKLLTCKQKTIQRENDQLKQKFAGIKIRGNEPLSKKEAGIKDIVADIGRINNIILELIRKAAEYGISLKDIKLTDDFENIDAGLFDGYYPPATPLFKLISREAIEDCIVNSKDGEKVEEMYKEHVLNFLDM